MDSNASTKLQSTQLVQIGEKYGIPGLKTIALSKFETLAKAYAQSFHDQSTSGKQLHSLCHLEGAPCLPRCRQNY